MVDPAWDPDLLNHPLYAPLADLLAAACRSPTAANVYRADDAVMIMRGAEDMAKTMRAFTNLLRG